MIEKKDFARFGISLIVASIVVVVIIWRYVSVMLLTPGRQNSQGSTYAVERGPILDRNSRILAIQTQLESVTAWIPNITDAEDSAERLANALDMEKSSITEIFLKRKSFAFIKRKVSPKEGDQIRNLKNEGFLAGIHLEREFARTYPEQNLASHVIGIVDIDNQGLEGIELTYDSELSPLPNGKKDVFGNQVFLTLDVNAQYFAEKYAREAYEDNLADNVMILVLDAFSGEYLAYASAPDFNPNSYGSFPYPSRLNRPSLVAYEPGSVFKIFSISAFLELGGINQFSNYYCQGYYEHLDIKERIKCLGIHHSVSPSLIIKYSCNAGAAYSSESVNSDDFYRLLKAFGFGEATGLPFSGESNGLLKKPQNWSPRTKPTVAFGQELSTSAAQIITAATVFANSGILIEPHMVKKIVSAEGKTIKIFSRNPLREVISADTAAAMLTMMESTTEPDGTAFRARIDGIRIAAKTGTAQMYDAATRKYSEDKFVASCIAIFPVDSPRFIIYVAIVNPKAGDYYGGRIASPVVKKVAEDMVQYFGIPRDTDEIAQHSGDIRVPALRTLRIGDTIPNLAGYSKRELLPLFNQDDIEIVIRGEGWVVRQNIPPGTAVAKGMKMILELQ